MSGTKIFFIFLILLVVLFVVVEVIGAHNNSTAAPGNCQAASDKLKCQKDAFLSSSGDHSSLQGMSTVLAPFSPRAQLTPKSFALSSSKKQPQLTAPADDSHPFRKVEVTMLPPGCGTVTYKANGGVSSELKDLQQQEWPGDKDDTSKPANLVILKSGGTLDFGLNPKLSFKPPTCEITLN